MFVQHSPEVRRAAAMCFQRGWGYRRTATELDVPPATVRDWFRMWRSRGTFDGGAAGPRRSYGPEVREAVTGDRSAGMTWSELERKYGIARRTMRGWCAEDDPSPVGKID